MSKHQSQQRDQANWVQIACFSAKGPQEEEEWKCEVQGGILISINTALHLEKLRTEAWPQQLSALEVWHLTEHRCSPSCHLQHVQNAEALYNKKDQCLIFKQLEYKVFGSVKKLTWNKQKSYVFLNKWEAETRLPSALSVTIITMQVTTNAAGDHELSHLKVFHSSKNIL